MPITHSPATDAELAAVERLSRTPGHVATRRAQVLRTLVDHYRVELVGLTRIEIAVLMGTTRDHVHPRIMELERGGWVERSEAPGRNGVVFVPTDKALTWQEWVDAAK